MANDRVRVAATVAAVILAAILLVTAAVVKPAQATSRKSTASIDFSSDRKAMAHGSFNVYRLAGDGHGPTEKLTIMGGDNVMPTWSAAGSEVAFVHSELNGIPDIYRMNADDSGETPLTEGLLFEADPAWFPGGQKMVLSNLEDLYAMTLDASGDPVGAPTRLTRNAGVDRHPVVSPDGEQIAFSSNRTSDYEIWRIRADGTKPINLTKSPTSRDLQPAWQPLP
jgi:Tol biopolymer transport system component